MRGVSLRTREGRRPKRQKNREWGERNEERVNTFAHLIQDRELIVAEQLLIGQNRETGAAGQHGVQLAQAVGDGTAFGITDSAAVQLDNRRQFAHRA